MVCEAFNNIASFSDFLVWPTGCDYYFYLKILLTIGVILAGIMHKAQEDKTSVGDFISSLFVSVIAIDILAIIGSLVKNSSDIPMIQGDILLIIIAISIPIILLEVFRGD